MGLKIAAQVEAVSPPALSINEFGRNNEPWASEMAPTMARGTTAAMPIAIPRRHWPHARHNRHTTATRNRPS